jgi:predicted nucleic acid-binding protein
MVVIADTTPINYLVLTGQQDLLPTLFGRLVIPDAVLRELRAAATPQVVREWMRNPPEWLEIRTTTGTPDQTLSHLERGERQAIQLAEELSAELLLVDEKAARREAAKRNLRTTGTLGVLDLAADKGLVDFAQTLQLLKETSFYISPSVERYFLERDARRKEPTNS